MSEADIAGATEISCVSCETGNLIVGEAGVECTICFIEGSKTVLRCTSCDGQVFQFDSACICIACKKLQEPAG